LLPLITAIRARPAQGLPEEEALKPEVRFAGCKIQGQENDEVTSEKEYTQPKKYYRLYTTGLNRKEIDQLR
jgi:hypothetical protein